MIIKKGWLVLEDVDKSFPFIKKTTSHYDERPDEKDISLLVIHNISLPPGDFNNSFVEDFFMGSLDASQHAYFQEINHLRVSSHLYIRRDGSVIQFVPFHKRAWHAGVSEFEGRERCNDFSIGIELQGEDNLAYSEQQYTCLVQVTQNILQAYPLINQERITGHSDIAPGRKTDPGPAFDWQRYLSQL